MDEERHDMDLVEKYEDGRERFFCSECGYDFIMTWPPNYHRKILEKGDSEEVGHRGQSGILSGGVDFEMKVSSRNEEEVILDESVWGSALDGVKWDD